MPESQPVDPQGTRASSPSWWRSPRTSGSRWRSWAAALLTRSSAMLAETFHAVADSGNEVLLLIARSGARRQADQEHPLGHGREAYFWALITCPRRVRHWGVACRCVKGILEMVHPTRSTCVPRRVRRPPRVAHWSSRACRSCARIASSAKKAAELNAEFIEHIDLGNSDSIARAIFAEDAAAVMKNVIAGSASRSTRCPTGSSDPRRCRRDRHRAHPRVRGG